jgi:hypothetical protein
LCCTRTIVHCYTLRSTNTTTLTPLSVLTPYSTSEQILSTEQTNPRTNHLKPITTPSLHPSIPHHHKKLNLTIYFFPFPFLTTTLKLPLAGSSFGVSGFAGPFLATSLQPPGATLAGLPLLGGVEVSTRPLSARRLRRMNSSAKWRESMVEELPWTASVMSSASAGKKMRSATNCSAGRGG